MNDLWTAITAWPVIVQGALGSALFGLFMYLGQRLATYVASHVGALSKERKRSELLNQITRIRAVTAETIPEKGAFASLLWLRASRSFIKALIWLTLGLFMSSFVPVLDLVGYLGAIFYLFSSLNVVKAIYRDGTEDEQLKSLAEALRALDGDG